MYKKLDVKHVGKACQVDGGRIRQKGLGRWLASGDRAR
jgi:hypothetical protein